MLRDCLGEADEGLDLFTQSYFYTLAFCQTIKIENLRRHINKVPQ